MLMAKPPSINRQKSFQAAPSEVREGHVEEQWHGESGSCDAYQSLNTARARHALSNLSDQSSRPRIPPIKTNPQTFWRGLRPRGHILAIVWHCHGIVWWVTAHQLHYWPTIVCEQCRRVTAICITPTSVNMRNCFSGSHGGACLPTVLEARSLNKVDNLAAPVYQESRNHPGRLQSMTAYWQACRSRNAHLTLRTRSTLKYIDNRQNSRSKAPNRAILCC